MRLYIAVSIKCSGAVSGRMTAVNEERERERECEKKKKRKTKRRA